MSNNSSNSRNGNSNERSKKKNNNNHHNHSSHNGGINQKKRTSTDWHRTGVRSSSERKKNTGTGTYQSNATRGVRRSGSFGKYYKQDNSVKPAEVRKTRNREVNVGKNGRNIYRREAKRRPAENPYEELRVIPLGGMREIGKNITAIECCNQILIIDCGFSFPQDDMYGVDVVIPDFTYLKENADKVRGLIITHGHEDHIGGVPYLLQSVKTPIYAVPLANGLITNKLKEFNLSADLHDIKAGDVFQLGCFKIEAVRTNHSIADALAFYIKSPGGNIFHTGDFKIDYTPLDGKMIDLGRYAEIGNEGVDVMISESTNILKPGFTPSERIVVDSMNRIFEETDKRIIIATFSSNIYRIKYFMEASIKHGRKIAISGRSMENVTKIATSLGYLNIPETAFADIRQIGNIPDNNLTIITTGSQGEPMSALTRMANDMHRTVKLKKGDVVVFSSSPIPGNDKAITDVVNKLYEKRVEVKLSDFVDIHVSGHACREEHKLIHTLINPKYLIPAHGEYRHLIEHARLAQDLGMSPKHIFVMRNGDSLYMHGREVRQDRGYVPAEPVLVDGYGIGDVSNVVLRDRRQLSEAGLITISIVVDRKAGVMTGGPELMTRGFIYVKDNGPFIQEAIDTAVKVVRRCEGAGHMDYNTLKNALRDEIRGFVYKRTKRSPVILPVVLYV